MKNLVIQKRHVYIFAGLGFALTLLLMCVLLISRSSGLNSGDHVGSIEGEVGVDRSSRETLNHSLPVLSNSRKRQNRNTNRSSDQNQFQNRQPLSQEEFESLKIPGLSVRSSSLSQSYIDFAGLSEEDVNFIQMLIGKLIVDIKNVEASKAKILEDFNEKKVIFIPSYPEEGRDLEGEFRFAFRERFGEWQEDLFMKLNRTFFATWLGEFGKMEQQITLTYPEGGPYRFEVGTAVPVNLFSGPKELAKDLHNRLLTEVSFQETFIPDRFSHLLEIK